MGAVRNVLFIMTDQQRWDYLGASGHPTLETPALDALAAKGRQAVIVVSPAIRKEFSKIIRQHIDDIVVLAFTELPETRKIEVVATITGEADS